jgi:hypothetical protein
MVDFAIQWLFSLGFLYDYQAGYPSVFVSPGSGSGVGKSPSDAGADPDESQAFSADVL